MSLLLPLHNNMLLAPGVVSAAITGTALTATEQQIRDGGLTIVITLTNDTFPAAGAAFDAVRQDIIDGLDSSGSETLGWNNEVRDKEVVTAVVRTSDTVVTITLSAQSGYDITADETITVTVPASALVTSASAVVGSPTFDVTFIPVVVDQPSGGMGDVGFDFRELFRKQVIEEDREILLIIRAFLDKVA